MNFDNLMKSNYQYFLLSILAKDFLNDAGVLKSLKDKTIEPGWQLMASMKVAMF